MPSFEFKPSPQRSENMRKIRAKHTRPEIAVRKLCRDLGYRSYRLNRTDLPGKPDIAFVGRKTAIYVNGCFWHGHDCKVGKRRPKTNLEYWLPKIARNQERDSHNIASLQAKSWRVLVIWECELKYKVALSEKLFRFLNVNV